MDRRRFLKLAAAAPFAPYVRPLALAPPAFFVQLLEAEFARRRAYYERWNQALLVYGESRVHARWDEGSAEVVFDVDDDPV